MILALFMFVAQVSSEIALCGRPDIVCHPAFDGERDPLSAVDHVAVRIVTPIGGPRREERLTVTRSGPRYREDRQSERGPVLSYTDLASKLHVAFLRNPAGRYEHLSADRPNPETGYYTFRRVRTGARDQALGETCDVWATRRLNAADYDSTFLTCLTADGVELWTRIQSRSGIEDYSRTISIERRPVLPSEVTPPPDIFDPRQWEGIASAPRPPPPRGGQASDYEVRLAPDPANRRPGSVIDLTIRARDGWRSETASMADGRRRWSLVNPAGRFQFWASRLGSGELQHLQMNHYPVQTTNASGDSDPGESLGTSERLLGESCTWYTPNGLVTEMSEARCLTADGILLALRRTYHMGGDNADVRAVSLRRHPPAMASLFPPPEILGIDAWRWTPR